MSEDVKLTIEVNDKTSPGPQEARERPTIPDTSKPFGSIKPIGQSSPSSLGEEARPEPPERSTDVEPPTRPAGRGFFKRFPPKPVLPDDDIPQVPTESTPPAVERVRPPATPPTSQPKSSDTPAADSPKEVPLIATWEAFKDERKKGDYEYMRRLKAAQAKEERETPKPPTTSTDDLIKPRKRKKPKTRKASGYSATQSLSSGFSFPRKAGRPKPTRVRRPSKPVSYSQVLERDDPEKRIAKEHKGLEKAEEGKRWSDDVKKSDSDKKPSRRRRRQRRKTNDHRRNRPTNPYKPTRLSVFRRAVAGVGNFGRTSAPTIIGSSVGAGVGSATGSGVIGSAAGTAAGGLTASAASAGPIGIGLAVAAGGTVLALTALTQSAKAAYGAIDKMTHELSEVSGQVAGAYAMSEVRQLQAQLRRDQALGKDAAGFVTEQGKLSADLTELGTNLLKPLVPLMTDMLGVLRGGVALIKPLTDTFGRVDLDSLKDYFNNHPVLAALTPLDEIVDVLRWMKKQAKKEEDIDLIQDWIDFLNPAKTNIGNPAVARPPNRIRGAF